MSSGCHWEHTADAIGFDEGLRFPRFPRSAWRVGMLAFAHLPLGSQALIPAVALVTVA